MLIKEGSIVEGIVTGITNFGAFVELSEGKTGLVHISEISHDYVEKVDDYLKKKEKVRVKILSIEESGKISLSIRQAKPQRSKNQPEQIDWAKKKKNGSRFVSFEDKLDTFIKDSSERQTQLKNRDSKRNNAYRGK